MNRSLLGLAAAVFAGCGPDVVRLELPEDGPAGAVVFVVEADEVTVFASERGAPPPLELRLGPGSGARIYAVQYAAPLARLGLAPGPVPTVAEAECGAQALPAQDALHAADVGEGGDGAWRRLDERPAAVRAVRIAGACPCRRFETVDEVSVPLTAGWFSDDERVLLLTADGEFLRLDRFGNITPVPGAVTAPIEGLTALGQGPNGEIWLGVGTSLLEGAVDVPFAVTATLTMPGDAFSHLGGGTGPDGFELYGATVSGNLVRLQPGDPILVRGPAQVAFSPEQRGRIVWLGPGRVVASEHASMDVFWMDGEREVGRVTLPPTAGGLRFLFRVDEEIFAITNLSAWFRLTPRDVEPLPGPRLGTARGVVVSEGAFVTSGDTGYLQEYRVGFGFCPTQQLAGEPRVVGLIPVDDRVVAIALGPSGEPPRGLVLEPRPWTD